MWSGAQLVLDVVFAATIEAGLPAESVRYAISTPAGVNTCPHCSDSLFKIQAGSHECEECGWSESADPITSVEPIQARATAWIEHPYDETEDTESQLKYIEYPTPDELPDPNDVLILDATPTEEFYQYLFGVDEGEIHVKGDDSVALNARITQIVDGQFHRSTLLQEDEDHKSGKRRREKIQAVIDRVHEMHDEVVLIGHKQAENVFEYPSSTKWIRFYAGRGLDYLDADALVIIGAPHPNLDSLKRKVELLTLGRDVEIGGIEQSEQAHKEGRGKPGRFRQYRYDDGTGCGYKIKQKTFSGLIGKLFEDAREKELVQMLHRIRPAIAKYPKDIYLLTNIPLDVPIDTLTALKTLAGTDHRLIGEGEQTLLESLTDLATNPSDIDLKKFTSGFSLDGDELQVTVKDLVHLIDQTELEVTGQTVRNWRAELERLGLLVRTGERIDRAEIHVANKAKLKRALLVLTNNGHLNLQQVQQLQSLVAEADGSDEWLEKTRSIIPPPSSKDITP